MTLPPITESQDKILRFLLKFRFLNTHHFQKLFNHKNPSYILVWLRDLKEKGYINMIYDRKKFGENTKPAVFYLGLKARHHFKKDKDCDLKALNKIYREKKREKPFINQWLFLADVYFFFRSQKDVGEELNFFTENELSSYEFFPIPKPSAYIAVETKASTRRYFLESFEYYTPDWVLRKKVTVYLKYSQEGYWEANAKNEPFPSILFICPDENAKRHVNYYAKALLDKLYDDKLAFFVTTRNTILYGKNKNIWQKVE